MFASSRNVNPMQREFGDLQNLFAWDLDSKQTTGTKNAFTVPKCILCVRPIPRFWKLSGV